jgi:hypothetical protein
MNRRAIGSTAPALRGGALIGSTAPAVRALPRLGLLTWLALAGCHGATHALTARAADEFWARNADSRWQWVEAECSDGALDLGQLGFDRLLTLDTQNGKLLLTFDTELAVQGCNSTAVWQAQPGGTADAWRFEPQAIVNMPPDTKCGAAETAPTEGNMRLFGDELELSVRGSPWCRGYDARFVFRRAPRQGLSPAQVVMHYAAAFNRRDPDAVAALFVDSGALVEPFTRTDDGNYKRHDGRPAVRAWYASAFASAPWLALRLTGIEPGDGPGQVTARWDYVDARLAEPVRGRNLFVIAGGEIYESEVQLLDDPKERAHAAAPAVSAAQSSAAAPASTGGAP